MKVINPVKGKKEVHRWNLGLHQTGFRDISLEISKNFIKPSLPYLRFCVYLKWLLFFIGFSSVQLLSHVRLSVTPWTAAHQASLSITNSWSLLKPMSVDSVMPSNHLILCPLLLPPSIFPSIRVFSKTVFQMSHFFESSGQSIGVSASVSVLPMNIQDRFPLGWTGWISLQSKGLSRVFSNTPVQKHQHFSTQLSLQSNSHIHT